MTELLKESAEGRHRYAEAERCAEEFFKRVGVSDRGKRRRAEVDKSGALAGGAREHQSPEEQQVVLGRTPGPG